MYKIGSRSVLVLASVLVWSGMAQLPAQGGETPHATGLIPISPEEEARIKREWKKVERVGLNELGLKRVNAARKAKGLAELPCSSAEPLGAETSTDAAGTEAPAALPAYVDNSTLKYFPPIRSQGSIASCISWCTTYYQLTHNTALARDWDAKNGGDLYRFSPKWTYNFVNGGGNNGTTVSSNYNVLTKHGSARWSEFPYDSNYLAWSLNPAVWRGAISCRPNAVQYISSVSSTGLDQVKQLLTDGYVVTFATYVTSWQFKNAGNDPATAADDSFAGKGVCFWLNGTEGAHGMTFVGYSDDIWVDINSNGVVDTGEKGALRVANSWGTGYKEAGFTWLAYDALLATSAVSGGPSAGRVRALQSDMSWHLPAKAAYTPKVVAEFTVNHLKRNQLRMNLGLSATSATSPTTTWYPGAISLQGGAYAFDGGTTAVDGTFVFDFTDLAPTVTEARRWYVGMYDNTTGDIATLKAFKLINVSTGEVATCGSVPKTADAAQAYAWIDWTYGSGANTAPTISDIANQTVNEDVSTSTMSLTIGDAETPADSLVLSKSSSNLTLVPLANIVFGGSGTARTVRVTPAANQYGTATITLTVTDAGGLSASDSFILTVNPVNDAPVANAQSVTLSKNTSKAVTLTGSDVDGNPLTYGVVTGPAHGVLSGTAPNLTYTPAADYSGADSFAFRAYDGALYSNTATVSITVTQPEMVAWWKLDETSGTTASDSTGKGHPGTLQNTAAWTTSGKIDGALQLTGANDMFLVSPNLPLAPEWTICSWFTAPLPATGVWHTLTRSQSNDHHIITDSGLVLGMYDNATGGGFRSCGYNMGGLSAGWHHVTAVGSGTTTKFYVDGVYVGVSDRKAATSDVYAVGNYQGGNQRFSDKIDDVRVYNYALSGTEIAALANVTPNNAPIISNFSPANPATVPAGTTQVFSADAYDADGDALSFSWKLDGAGVGITVNYMSYSPTAADAGAHTIEITVSDGKGGTVSQTWAVTVTVPATPPSITTQPASVTVTTGQTATFSVVAAGTDPLSYQWYKNGAAVSGATSASYTTPATTTADSGAKFKVVVTNSAGSATSSEATLTVNKATPVITWANPAAITYGTALSSTQLNASANVAGSFVYTPAAGTVLSAGSQTLSTTFTPTDTANYNTATKSVTLTVNKATPVITWANPAAITYGTALSSTQLNASANVAGSFVYTPAAGTVLSAGSQTLSTTFTPTDTANYNTATKSVTLTVNKATPVITWANPAAITYGTALSSTQLNASANVAGSFVYTPAAGTVLGAGSQTLSTTFTPTDTANYNTATKSVTLTVNKATPVITWANPAAITYGTALSSTQLNASANVAGSFVYTPAAGTVLAVGTHTLSTAFTPTDTANYNGASATVTLTVNSAAVAPSITTQPASVTVTEGQTATFSVVAAGTDPLSYQWYKNGAAISGATSASYTTPTTVAADNGSKFKVTVTNSAGSATSNEATLTVNVPTYTITASAGTGGTISPSGSVTVSQGASQTFAIAASSGYQIAGVTVDGTSVGLVSSYTFSNVTANHTIAATFVPAAVSYSCVSRIDLVVAKQSVQYFATGQVYVVDQNGAAVSGATVTVQWSGAVKTSTATATTGADGVATFTSARAKKTGPFTLTVGGIAADGLPYDPAKNTVTTASATY
jgi:C1A family cysteine protease